MKRLQTALGVILLSLAGCVPAMADAEFPQLVAKTTGSVQTVWVTTTPAPIISTGTAVNEYGVPFNVNRGTSAPTVSQGQVMPGRYFIEIFNDSAVDIYLGYNALVSSTSVQNRGRRIPPGGSWSHDCAVRAHWAIAGSSTGYNVTVTQEK